MFSVVQFTLGQEKSKKQLKAEQELKKQEEITALVDSKSFEFSANYAQPLGVRDLNIQGQQYGVVFKPDEINSYLPYFGRAYNISYGGDDGLKFKGAPLDYKMEKKKKFYLITTTVKGTNDTFNLMVSVYFQGNATLNITSNQRNPITFTGTIAEIKNKQ